MSVGDRWESTIIRDGDNDTLIYSFEVVDQIPEFTVNQYNYRNVTRSGRKFMHLRVVVSGLIFMNPIIITIRISGSSPGRSRPTSRGPMGRSFSTGLPPLTNYKIPHPRPLSMWRGEKRVRVQVSIYDLWKSQPARQTSQRRSHVSG